MKTVLLNIQLDDIKMSQVEEIEDAIVKAIEKFPRKRITMNITDTFGPPIPLQET